MTSINHESSAHSWKKASNHKPMETDMNKQEDTVAEYKESDSPFFSVVIPVYNVEQYLAECLDSILRQTFSDFEIIAVDDGSSDNSGKILDEYALKDSRIRVFHQENKGSFLTRVVTHSKARGKYIVSVDSDDMIKENALETIHSLIDRHQVDVVCISFSKSKDYQPEGKPFFFEPNVVLGKEEFVNAFLSTERMNGMPRKCFKREYAITEEVAKKYQPVLAGEDAILSLKVIDNCSSWIYCSEPLYFYRPNPNSITTTFRLKLWDDVKTVHEATLPYAKKWDKEFGKGTEYENMAYAKALIGAMNCATRICSCTKTSDEAIKFLKEIRDDPSFEEYYKKGNKKVLNRKRRLFAFLLHHRRYFLIRLIKRFYR